MGTRPCRCVASHIYSSFGFHICNDWSRGAFLNQVLLYPTPDHCSVPLDNAQSSRANHSRDSLTWQPACQHGKLLHIKTVISTSFLTYVSVSIGVQSILGADADGGYLIRPRFKVGPLCQGTPASYVFG